MAIRFNPTNTVRWTLFILTAALSVLFQPEVFSIGELPAAVITGLIFAEFSLKKRIRFLPALGLLAALLFLAAKSARLTAALIGDTMFTDWYVRLSLTALPILAAALAAFASDRLYRTNDFWKPLEPLALLALFCFSFWNQGSYRMTVFDHPLKAAGFALAFFIITLAALLLSLSGRKRRFASIPILLPFLLLAGFLGVRNFSTGSVSANGGLIQPTLFRFDFSPFLSLQSDISLNDRLVLIAHVPEDFSSSLLRRMSLSGWDPAKGFYEETAPGEAGQTVTVPSKPVALNDPGYLLRNTVRQEYFIVNFDPKSLIAIDYPVRIEPYKIWKTETFNGAFAVTSRTTGFIPFELYDSPPPAPDTAENLQLSPEALEFYTRIDPETDSFINPLALSLTEGITGYYDRITALNLWLLGDSFRYSLHPGTASDGNQLRYFLTETRRGYCTYYAFALALLCRSLDIPARVAAGFFMVPDSGALDYYPVRSNMAHAWVEVFFPKYGWVSFDPTNQTPAEGENIQFDFSPRGDEFLDLLNEIIERKSELAFADGTMQGELQNRNLLLTLNEFLQKTGWRGLFGLFLLPLFFLFKEIFRSALLYLTKNPRRAVLLAEGLAKNPLKKASGHPEIRALGEALQHLANKARFSPDMDHTDAERARSLLKSIRSALRSKNRKTKGARNNPSTLILVFTIIISSFLAYDVKAQETPDQTGPDPASQLLDRANKAIAAENWESATNLLLEGKGRFPNNAQFPYTLGNLFLDQELYPAAIRELETALDLGFSKPDIYLQLSDATSYENRDEESLLWLRRYTAEVPDNLSAWASFGWLCYKTHRFSEGIIALNRIVETWGPDGNVLVGLGNLYSAVYDYDNAKDRYTKAIKQANEKKQQYLASVYYYNRSILEESFYRFNDAYHDAALSLEASPRASGYLMQAELELRKLDYRSAAERYAKAQNLDSTPLATIGLAETFMQAGYPDKAYAQLLSVTANTDRSWIANYGTTTRQFSSDLYRLERDYWHLQKNLEKRKVVHSFSTALKRLYFIFSASFKEWLHEAKFRLSTLDIARTYAVPDEAESAGSLYYHSFKYVALDRWPDLAKSHLASAEDIETVPIPLAKPSYSFEWGALKKDLSDLDEAIRTLDPVWEREILSEALGLRLKTVSKGNYSNAAIISGRLFQLDPARFLKDDLKLQVRFNIDSALDSGTAGKIITALRRTGFQKNTASELLVSLRVIPEGISISLKKDNGNITSIPQVIHNSRPSAQVIAESVNSFSTVVFQADLGKSTTPQQAPGY